MLVRVARRLLSKPGSVITMRCFALPHPDHPMRTTFLPFLVAPLCALPGDDSWTQAELEQVTASIQKQIEEIRGESFQRGVKVEITDREGFLSYARARLDETESPEAMEADETIAKVGSQETGTPCDENSLFCLHFFALTQRTTGHLILVRKRGCLRLS